MITVKAKIKTNCSDRYGDYPSGRVTDPAGPSTGSSRVDRGGGWNGSARFCRSAIRGIDAPVIRGNNLGFRLVRTTAKEQAAREQAEKDRLAREQAVQAERDRQAREQAAQAEKEEKIVVDEEALPAPDAFVAYEEPPVPVSQPKPVYPEMARKAGIEGMVLLQVLVDKEGKVRDVRVIKGMGAGLDEAAIASVRASTWMPAIQNHKPVAVWVSYPIRFRLR